MTRKFSIKVRADLPWQIEGPALKPTAQKLSGEARRALLMADLPDDAHRFLFDAMFARAPRGHRQPSVLYDQARQEYEAAPHGQKKLVLEKFARAQGKTVDTVLRTIRRHQQRQR